MAYLLVSSDGGESHRVILKGPVTLGRSLKCDLWLNDNALSREHCRITAEGDGWWIEDLNSRNGTYVDKMKLDGKHKLFDGDTIRIGGSKIEFHAADAQTVRAENPAEAEFARLIESEAQEREIQKRIAAMPTKVSPPPQPVARPAAPAVEKPRVEMPKVNLPPRPMPLPRVNSQSETPNIDAEKDDSEWQNGTFISPQKRQRPAPIVKPRPKTPE
jgi:predicted component of type VI protein secretion system